eukprot:m.946018 g.946018  ORF g.946018 m.946018 type:complete len:69 (+) comp291308_c0_seq1:68-274(+)
MERTTVASFHECVRPLSVFFSVSAFASSLLRLISSLQLKTVFRLLSMCFPGRELSAETALWCSGVIRR